MPQTEATEAPVGEGIEASVGGRPGASVGEGPGASVTEAAPHALHRPRLQLRLRWWRELPLILLVYGAYSVGRLLARGDTASAVDHGLAILRVEKALWLNAEHPLNRLFTREPWIGIPADFWYASLHYLVTPVLLVWLFRSRAVHYRAARTWLLTSTFIGLIGFTLFPTCPPRLLHSAQGFVDTMAHYSAWGWWGGEASAPRGLGGMTNQYAAMPSLHVGWSLWCGVILWRLGGGSRLVRTAAVTYPLITTIVVMGTANHYFLDAVAGAAVMGVGLLLTPMVMQAVDRCRVSLELGVSAELRASAGPGTSAGLGASARPGAPTGPGVSAGLGASTAPGTSARPGASAGPGAPTELGASAKPGAFTGPEWGRVEESVAAGSVTPVAGGSRGTVSPIVSGGCQTSPGERIPRQRITEPEPGAAPSEAGDGAAAASR
ncbi:phosphatase PAP2 family protein [Streptomyces tailanensis]|uniref:phosphatase PAP2 family protein n=1 Tax=Streptomyces tailanensis TaxID=2569858 RepID=UPI00122E4961|nr:phosphatase PAP2 family protein [Streptomyces tailanensis]